MNENIKWNIIQKYFKDNPNILIKHQIDSFNDFLTIKYKTNFQREKPN